MTALRKNDPARMFRPVDLSVPGALDELLSLHRMVFGGFRMEDEPKPDPKPEPKPDPKPDEYKPPQSQADLDRIVGDRLAREREKYADYGDLKKKAEEYDKAAEAAKTEAEKAIDAARKEGESTATTAANARIVKAEAKAMAATAKFRDPADAVAFLSLTDIKVDENGDVDAAALKEQLDKLATDKPYLVDDGKKPTPKPDPGQGGGDINDKPSVQRGAEMYAARRGKKTA